MSFSKVSTSFKISVNLCARCSLLTCFYLSNFRFGCGRRIGTMQKMQWLWVFYSPLNVYIMHKPHMQICKFHICKKCDHLLLLVFWSDGVQFVCTCFIFYLLLLFQFPSLLAHRCALDSRFSRVGSFK